MHVYKTESLRLNSVDIDLCSTLDGFLGLRIACNLGRLICFAVIVDCLG